MCSSVLESEYITSLENLCRESDASPVELDLSQAPGPYTLPPEIYDYNPSTKDIYLMFNIGTEREVPVRQIFLSTKLSPFEMQLLKNIRNIFADRQIIMPEYLNSYLLRVCYYNLQKYKQEDYLFKSYQQLLEMHRWRKSIFPLSDRNEVLRHHLQKGAIYWEGRDQSYHPLLVVRMERFVYPILPDQFNKLIAFCFEWAFKYLFVPGRVESCVVLFDLRYVSTYQFSLKMITSIIQLLSYQYPFRLNHMHILHDSILLHSSWKFVQKCLTEVQQQKITLWRSSMGNVLLETFSPYQIEQDFGGLRDRITTFYPFPLPAGPFHRSATGSQLISCRNEWKLIKTPCGLSTWELVETSSESLSSNASPIHDDFSHLKVLIHNKPSVSLDLIHKTSDTIHFEAFFNQSKDTLNDTVANGALPEAYMGTPGLDLKSSSNVSESCSRADCVDTNETRTTVSKDDEATTKSSASPLCEGIQSNATQDFLFLKPAESSVSNVNRSSTITSFYLATDAGVRPSKKKHLSHKQRLKNRFKHAFHWHLCNKQFQRM